jgi:hypothetical protein
VTVLEAAGHGVILSEPVATVLASIAGALITGFGAATLKHRWDIRAEARQWSRSRDQRIRAQLLEAFSGYLVARPDLQTIPAITANPEDATVVVSRIQLAAASLLILLAAAEDRDVIETDLARLEEWIAASLHEPSKANWKDGPPVAAILDLARRLAVEPQVSDVGAPGGSARWLPGTQSMAASRRDYPRV